MISDVEIAVMEQEIRLSQAETVKKQVSLRIAQRERDNQRDRDHLGLQDAEIEKARAEIARLRAIPQEG